MSSHTKRLPNVVEEKTSVWFLREIIQSLSQYVDFNYHSRKLITLICSFARN